MIKGTQLHGNWKRHKTEGFLKERRVKYVYLSDNVITDAVLNNIYSSQPAALSEHSYKTGRYVVKFYPSQSFGILSYCKSMELPVETPVGMGVDIDGNEIAIITNFIEGLDYSKIILDGNRNFLGMVKIPEKEMRALGKTAYMFCSKSVSPGDNKLQNYVYDGTHAVRIDIVPDFVSIVDAEWDRVNRDIKDPKIYIEKRDEIKKLIDYMYSFSIDMAHILAHRPQSRRRFKRNLSAFLSGYENDELSRYISMGLWSEHHDLLNVISVAERESKSFQNVYNNQMGESGGRIIMIGH